MAIKRKPSNEGRPFKPLQLTKLQQIDLSEIMYRSNPDIYPFKAKDIQSRHQITRLKRSSRRSRRTEV